MSLDFCFMCSHHVLKSFGHVKMKARYPFSPSPYSLHDVIHHFRINFSLILDLWMFLLLFSLLKAFPEFPASLSSDLYAGCQILDTSYKQKKSKYILKINPCKILQKNRAG